MTPTLDAAWLDAMLEAERHDEALEQLNAALEAQPDNARLYALRGNFWASAWHHRDAAEDWETALSLDPSLHEVQLQLALLEITHPYRLADGGDDDGFADDDGLPDDDVWSEEDEEESEAQLQRMLQEALEAGTGGAALLGGDEITLDGEIWPGDDEEEDDHAFFEFRSEDSLRAQGLTRLQQLADDSLLSEAQLLQAVAALSESAWLPWHALDLVQRGLAATPASPALQRARVALWISLATDLVDAGEDVPVGYSADLTGNLYHPVSAATALQYGDSLLAEAWDADLYESRAQLHRLLGNHAAAAADFNHAARLVESLAGSADSEAGDAARSRLQQLQAEIVVCEGGDSALIAARQQHMQDTLAQLADMQQALGGAADQPQDEGVMLDEARNAALDYIDTIGHDPLQDADYVAEVLAQIPGIADAILQTLENEPYDFRGLTERELFERVGDADAQLYVAERAAFVRQGYATIGWMELQSLSRRLGKPAILDLLLSPDQTTAGLCFVLGGVPTREVHTVFADGGSLSHATLRGRSAGWTPAPFRQAHLPPETPLELLLRLHGSAVSLPEQFDQLRQRRHEARLAQGFHDAEVRGYSGEHYRAGGQSLREALAAHLARLRPRTH